MRSPSTVTDVRRLNAWNVCMSRTCLRSPSTVMGCIMGSRVSALATSFSTMPSDILSFAVRSALPVAEPPYTMCSASGA